MKKRTIERIEAVYESMHALTDEDYENLLHILRCKLDEIEKEENENAN